MSNHKWNSENTCLTCGIKREMKEYKKWLYCTSYLSRQGIWEDKSVYSYGVTWYYGSKYKFERPQCELVKQGLI